MTDTSSSVDLDAVVQQASSGDPAARRALVERIHVPMYRLTAALCGDPTRAATLVVTAMDAALAEVGVDACAGAESSHGAADRLQAAVVRSVFAAVCDAAAGRDGVLGDLDLEAAALLLLVDTEGLAVERAASLLGLDPAAAGEHVADAREAVEAVPSTCPGWELVRRADHLTAAEQEAASGHMRVCNRCRFAAERRLLFQGRVDASAPMAVLVAALAGPAAHQGGAVLGGRRRSARQRRWTTAAAAATVGVVAAVAATLAVGAGRDVLPLATQREVASRPTTTAPAAPASPTTTAPLGGANEAGALPSSVPRPTGDTTGRPTADEAEGDDRASVAEPPAAGTTPTTQPPTGTAIAASGLVIAGADGYAAGATGLADHLRKAGRAVEVRGLDAGGVPELLAAISRLHGSSDGHPPVLAITAQTSPLQTGSIRLGSTDVPLTTLAAALPREPVVLVLDLLGPAAAAPSLDALSAPGRTVVAGFSATATAGNAVGSSAYAGRSAFAQSFWDDCVLADACDGAVDGRTTVEAAATGAARADATGVLVVVHLDDRDPHPTAI